MIVKELIAALQIMPSDAEVGYVWDGAARSTAEYVWLARSGQVLISDDQSVYDTENRPANAPSEEEDQFWSPSDTPSERTP